MIFAANQRFRQATLALSLGSFLIFANLYVTHPLLPLFSDQFQLTPLQSSWSLSVAMLTLGLSLLVYGPLSDALGRTPIMRFSLLGSVLSSLLITQINSYEQLLLLRAIQGFCLGGLPAVAIAYLAEEFDSDLLLIAVGLYIGANSLGGIGGRVLGGLAGNDGDWILAFELLSLVSVLGFLLFTLLLPPSTRFERKPFKLKAMFNDLRLHLRNPLLVAAYLVGGLNFFIFSNQFSYITYLLSEKPFSLPPAWLGLLFLCYLSGTLSSCLSGHFSQRLSAAQGMALGISMMILGSLATLFNDLIAIISGLLISSFGFFLCHSLASSWVGRHAGRSRASASCLYLVFYYLGAASGSFYLDLFWRSWHWPGVVFGSILILGITAALAIWLECAGSRRDSAVYCS